MEAVNILQNAHDRSLAPAYHTALLGGQVERNKYIDNFLNPKLTQGKDTVFRVCPELVPSSYFYLEVSHGSTSVNVPQRNRI